MGLLLRVTLFYFRVAIVCALAVFVKLSFITLLTVLGSCWAKSVDLKRLMDWLVFFLAKSLIFYASLLLVEGDISLF